MWTYPAGSIRGTWNRPRVSSPGFGNDSKMMVILFCSALLLQPSRLNTILNTHLINTGVSASSRQQDAHGNYAFGYEIKDKLGATNSRSEIGDGYGNKKGSYTLNDIDGRARRVDYVADGHGFRATVTPTNPEPPPAPQQLPSLPAPTPDPSPRSSTTSPQQPQLLDMQLPWLLPPLLHMVVPLDTEPPLDMELVLVWEWDTELALVWDTELVSAVCIKIS
ncbi:adult-specific rigid cuticular protein 15.7 [Caerostris extrusa]|uniref:Adult-specific rigid cuticular protein 15.7 n=1 Tax=Caerostris extrusa TaxID=172846 RepID=A0AAV4V9U1_CAEEX|nr:adult-specific rigid cuticular protein 15.7 [Caerostris extrusa]